jgi:NADP-dependent 3-hydroxy acid dehydrogenase YdfG
MPCKVDTAPMLDDRVIAVAGAGGGLGPVVAARLAAEGAVVAGTDRSQETLDALAADLGLPPERWDGRPADLLDEDAARAWCAALVGDVGWVG